MAQTPIHANNKQPAVSVFLDHAAGTFACTAARNAFLQVLDARVGNPSAQHPTGAAARELLRTARARVAAALAARPEDITFTSGGTEANNLALLSVLRARKKPGHILTSTLEHAAVRRVLDEARALGHTVTSLPPDVSGTLRAETVASALRDDTFFISLTSVCNETGAILPIAAVSAAAKSALPDVVIHTDAVQAFLKIPLDGNALGVDLLSISAHKCGGIGGVGALWHRAGLRLRPLTYGGGQEDGLRPGTEPLALLAAFGAAVEDGRRRFADFRAHLESIYAYAHAALLRIPGLTWIPPATREGRRDFENLQAPHILSFALPGYPSEIMVRVLGEHNVCVSAGSACSRGRGSEVLGSMKLPPGVADAALRISFSADTTEMEIDRLCEVLELARGKVLPRR